MKTIQDRCSEVGRQAGIARTNGPTLAIWFSDVDEDRAVDMVLVGPPGTYSVAVNRKNGTSAPSDTVRPPNPPRMIPGQASALGDYDDDGAIEEQAVDAGAVGLNRNDRRRPGG